MGVPGCGFTPRIGLRLGSGADPRVPVITGQVTTIPEQAVQVINGTSSVFVRRGPNQFEAVPVERGRRLAGDRIIITGLAADDAVVVVGAFTLKAELLKSTLGGE